MSQPSTTPTTQIQLAGVIHLPQHSIPAQILVDSGAEGDFIDTNFVKENNLPIYELPVPKEVHAVDSRLLEVIKFKTEHLKVTSF